MTYFQFWRFIAPKPILPAHYSPSMDLQSVRVYRETMKNEISTNSGIRLYFKSISLENTSDLIS